MFSRVELYSHAADPNVMRRKTKVLVVIVIAAAAALVFFFAVPVVPGIQDSCIYQPDAHQSLSFEMFGVGMTYSGFGYFAWTWHPSHFICA